MKKKSDTKHRILLILGFLIFILAIISSSSAATTIYVNNATGNDTNDGLTNSTAKATIQNGTNTVEDGGTVYVADGTYKEHVTISKNLTIIGQSTTGTIIDGTHNGRPLTINSGLTVNLSNISIVNGKVTDYAAIGGGIYNLGTLTMTNCNVENNIANGYSFDHVNAVGGGIYNSGTLTMTNCNVRNNTATATCYGSGAEDANALGGGIYNSGTCTLTMTNCNLEKNTVFSDWSKYFSLGGGLCNGGTAHIIGCNIINNIANSTGLPTAGGGIINYMDGSLTANFNRIFNNTPNSIASWWGGTVYNIEDNWWGSNDPDFGSLLAISTPKNWLYMTINATPSTINNTQTSLITVSFNNHYNGTLVTPYAPGVGEYVPDGTLVTFTTDLGSIGCKTIDKETSGGIATATLTADELAGIAHINALTDYQTVNVNVTINPTSSLYLTVTPNKAKPVLGDTVIYTLKVGNKGPDTAKDVVMHYVIPQGLEFAGAKVDVGNYTYDPDTRTITWIIGDVPVGDPEMNLTLHISSAGQYTLNPTLTTSTNDPTINTSTQSISINAIAANNNNETNNTTTVNAQGTVSMQHTGIPLNYLIMAILLVIGGLVIPKRK